MRTKPPPVPAEKVPGVPNCNRRSVSARPSIWTTRAGTPRGTEKTGPRIRRRGSGRADLTRNIDDSVFFVPILNRVPHDLTSARRIDFLVRLAEHPLAFLPTYQPDLHGFST